MATVRDIIEQAYRLIGIVAEDEPMSAAQAETGLFTFNAMMAGFEILGADPGHTDAALGDQSALPAQFTEAQVRTLASRLAPMGTRGPFDARRFEDALRAQFMQVETVKFPNMRPYRYWGGA
jgi:hypothetical protein